MVRIKYCKEPDESNRETSENVAHPGSATPMKARSSPESATPLKPGTKYAELQLRGTLLLDGGWILRRYSNDSQDERLLLARVPIKQKPCKVTKTPAPRQTRAKKQKSSIDRGGATSIDTAKRVVESGEATSMNPVDDTLRQGAQQTDPLISFEVDLRNEHLPIGFAPTLTEISDTAAEAAAAERLVLSMLTQRGSEGEGEGAIPKTGAAI